MKFMKNRNETTEIKKKGGMVENILITIYKKRVHLSIILIYVLYTATTVTVYADGADDMWTNLWDIVIKWVERIAWAAAFYGGVEFGLSFYNQDPAQRMHSFKFIGGSAIVLAICYARAKFSV